MHREGRVPDTLPLVLWRSRRRIAWWPGALIGMVWIATVGLVLRNVLDSLRIDVPDEVLYPLALPLGIIVVAIASVSHTRTYRRDAARHGPMIAADSEGLWFRIVDSRVSAGVWLAWHEVLDIGVTTTEVPNEPERTERCLYVHPANSALESLVDPELRDHVRDSMSLHRVPFVLREKELPDTADRVVDQLRRLAAGPDEVGPSSGAWRPVEE
ncbi:hypothetical protein J4H86_18095 [Spiractinospora alimapuensis]|uniref:hypothetical protein n=1 Tax=Spiractinospora alimapuensis TaxID=2820884 RepID=UPI001F2F0E22|nr:hypothetical protein [Spiractinospora alimapuensis]QVQ50776.1 hypothetical protein J4H86_18095 [Spiractinospora alimapuensis]